MEDYLAIKCLTVYCKTAKWPNYAFLYENLVAWGNMEQGLSRIRNVPTNIDEWLADRVQGQCHFTWGNLEITAILALG